MSSCRGGRPASGSRAAAKVGKNPVCSHLSLDSACQDNSVVRGDEQNNEMHTPFMNRSEQKKVLEENIRLKHELEDLRSQYKQLIEEVKNECFDERRVNLLKAQVLQLERQVVLLTEGLSSRATLLLEFSASLDAFNDKLSSFLSTEESALEIPIPRPELLQIIELCHAMRQKLHKKQQTSDLSKLALPWTLGGNLTKQPMTLLDLCYGKLENLNLRYVSALEGKLSKLRRHLFAMRQTLSLMLAPGQGPLETAHLVLPTAVYARLINQAAQCHQSVAECCSDLLTLTLLVPSAPWEILEYSLSQEFTVENVLAALPAFPKGGPQQRAKRAVEALVKAQNYSRQMAMQQLYKLEDEIGERLSTVAKDYLEETVDRICLRCFGGIEYWHCLLNLEYDNTVLPLTVMCLGRDHSEEGKVECGYLPKMFGNQSHISLSLKEQLWLLIQALQAELNFHRNLYILQVKYIDAVFSGIKQAYHRFQDNVAMVLCSPLQDVFPPYIKLKTEASEAALREFLTAFRNNAEQIQYAVETLTPMNHQHEGEEALSRFGKEFFLSLEHSLKACGEQRDKAANEMETLQTELDQALETLRNLKEQKGTKSGPSQHFPKQEEVKTEEIKASGLDVLSKKQSEPHSPSSFPPHRQSFLPKHASAEGKELNSSSSKLKPESYDGVAVQQKGKPIRRSRSMKSTARPPWQD